MNKLLLIIVSLIFIQQDFESELDRLRKLGATICQTDEGVFAFASPIGTHRNEAWRGNANDINELVRFAGLVSIELELTPNIIPVFDDFDQEFSLRKFSLHCVGELNEKVVGSIGRMRTLKELELIAQAFPNFSLSNLSALDTLEELRLAGKGFPKVNLELLATFENLRTVDLTGIGTLGFEDLETLPDIPNLEAITLIVVEADLERAKQILRNKYRDVELELFSESDE